PKAGTIPGIINGKNVPIQCKSAMITYEATRDPADGRIIVPSSIANRTFFAGKLNFAKLKPAIEQKKSTSTVLARAINIVFKKARKKSISASTWETFAHRLVPKN